jgi:uncharacterized membrane protein YozB (DUF420 family)
MSFLGTRAGILADMTLIIQIVAFVLLFSGVIYAKKKKYPEHFKIAYLVVFLGLLAFLWMGFSLINNFQALIYNLASPVSLLAVIHVTAGLAALLAGISFALNRFIRKIRDNMRVSFLLWGFAFLFGIVLYALYYL